MLASSDRANLIDIFAQPDFSFHYTSSNHIRQLLLDCKMFYSSILQRILKIFERFITNNNEKTKLQKTFNFNCSIVKSKRHDVNKF